MSKLYRHTAVAVLLCALLPHALGAPKTTQFASRDDLRTCMDSEQALSQRKTTLEHDQIEHAASLAAFQQESRAFYATEDSIDPFDANRLNAFNAHVQELNQRVETINRRAEQLTAESKQIRADMRAHNHRCASIIFKPGDKEAIEREQANQKPAQKQAPKQAPKQVPK